MKRILLILAAATLFGAPETPADLHNSAGLAHMQRNEFPQAADEFRKAVAARPDFVRAWNNLGSALAQAGEVEQAVAAFRKAVALDGSDPQLHMNLGIALRGKGDADAALEQFRIVLKSHASDPAVHLQLGLTLKQQGKLEAAADEFNTVLVLDSENREAYYNLGTVLRQQAAALRRGRAAARPDPEVESVLRHASDLKTARRSAEALVKARPNSAEALNALGFIQGQDRDLTASITTLRRAIELKPDLADARYNLGAALWYSGDRTSALTEIEESLRLNPGAAEVWSFLGMMRKERGETASAESALHRALALGPNLPAPYIDLALIFLRSGQPEKAIGQLEAALNVPNPAGPMPDVAAVISELRQHTKLPAAHNAIGLLLGKQGADPKQVESELREAIRLRPDYAEAHNNLGLVLMQMGDTENSISEFRAALRSAPDYSAALGNLGAALTPSKPDEAVRLLEKAVQLEPAWARAQYNLALAYAQTPQHGSEKAIAQFRKVLETQPDFAAAHFEFGKLLLRTNAVTEAIAQFREAVRIDPQLSAARYQLGLALTRAGQRDEGAAELAKARTEIDQDRKMEAGGQLMVDAQSALNAGQIDTAIEVLQKLTRLAPSPDVQLRLQAARQASAFEDYIRRQQFKELEPLVSDYLRVNPDSWWAHYVLGYALFGQQRIGDSIASVAKSLQLNLKNADAHRLLGRNLMIIGRFDAAQIELEQAVKLRPGSAELHYDLGKIFSAVDNYPPAKRELEEAIRLKPEYPEAIDALGFVMEALGDDAAALTHYRKAAEISEAHGGAFASPYVNMAAYYNRTGNPQLALENARKAVQLNPRSDGAYFQLAKALDRLEQWPEAEKALAQAIEINPRASSYRYVLAGVYRHLGKTRESQAEMETFRKLEKEAADFEERRRQARRAEARH